MRYMTELFVFILILIQHQYVGGVGCHNRCYPGQECFPGVQEIATFRKSLDGFLIDPVTAIYPNVTFMFNTWHRKFPALVVMVTSVKDIQRTLKFARRYNLHLTVKSSGHDYIGRSTWHGSVEINMSKMKTIMVNINSTRNEAGEVTIETGANFGQIYKEVDKYDRVVVGGSSLTVTPGGYTQGGGHSPLSRSLGLAVDQVLELQVVTIDSKIINCSANGTITQNEDGTITKSDDTDLFWALRGGGGSTFGIVVSYTFKLHKQPQQIVTAYIIYPLSINGDDTIGREVFKFYDAFVKNLPEEWGGYTLLTNKESKTANKTETGSMFLLFCHFGEWDKPSRRYIDQWEPFHRRSRTLWSLKNHTSFWQWMKNFGGSKSARMYQSNVLVQPDNVNDNLSNFLLNMMTTSESENYPHYSCTGTHIGGRVSDIPTDNTAVNPALRSALLSLSCDVVMKEPSRDSYFINKGKQLHTALNQHGTGVYVNEPAADTPQWQTMLWGTNYQRLVTIKQKWDPDNFLTCKYCVGSEAIKTSKKSQSHAPYILHNCQLTLSLDKLCSLIALLYSVFRWS